MADPAHIIFPRQCIHVVYHDNNDVGDDDGIDGGDDGIDGVVPYMSSLQFCLCPVYFLVMFRWTHSGYVLSWFH